MANLSIFSTNELKVIFEQVNNAGISGVVNLSAELGQLKVLLSS